MTCAIGLDIGGTKIAGAVFDASGKQRAEKIAPTPQDYGAFLDSCEKTIRELEKESGGLCTVGVGLPGTIDHARGAVSSVNLPFLKDRSLKNDLSQRLGRAIPIANDANCMALAEAVDGAGQGAESVLGLILGTGVGSGFVFRGQIVDGPNGMTGEIGLLPLPMWEKSYGGAASATLEESVSGPALARLYALMTGGAEKDAALIAVEARAGDADALRVLDRYYEILAKAMVVPVSAFDPYIIVVSGGLSSLPGLYEEVPERLKKYAFVKAAKTRFVPARHGPMAGLRGAAWLGKNAK